METRNLPVKLTTDEMDQRRDKLAALVREHAAVEEEKKDSTAAYGKQLKKLSTDMSAIAREIRERCENREVRVVIQKNLAAGLEEVTRSDTGEVIDSRALGPDELQADLAFVGRASDA